MKKINAYGRLVILLFHWKPVGVWVYAAAFQRFTSAQTMDLDTPRSIPYVGELD